MLDERTLRQLLEKVAGGETTVDGAVTSLRAMPFEDLGFVKLDHHRALRDAFPEVIYCGGKTPQQVATIVQRVVEAQGRVLATRATAEHYEATRAVTPAASYHETARIITVDGDDDTGPKLDGVAVVAAGTSDLPVAEEAAVTLEMMGHAPLRCYDVGVAGLHRLLAHVQPLQQANAIIVVAGMEGALPSVVGGLVSAPVIACPTSVGYGASFGGLAALLGMLNSCAAGVSVVNIDNGFGAGHLAAIINQRIHEARKQGAAAAGDTAAPSAVTTTTP